MRWLAVVGLMLAMATAAQELREDGSDPRLDGCEDVTWTGRHVSSWGMTFTIPDGFTGFPNSPMCTYHGVIIPLSQPPYEADRFVDMFAIYNALDSESARDACNALVKQNAREVARGSITLAGLRGHFVRLEQGAPTIEKRCFLRDGSSQRGLYEYSFTLVTPSTKLAEDQRVLASILDSLEWTSPER